MRTAALVRASTEWRSSPGCEDLPIVVQSANAMRFRSKSIKSIGSWIQARVAPTLSKIWSPWNHRTSLSSNEEVARPAQSGRRSGALAVALIAVVSFGSGIVAERYLFGGNWLGTGRLSGTSIPTAIRNGCGIPTAGGSARDPGGRILLPPASPEARATFWADLEQGAIEGMAIAAATPVESIDDYRRELD